MKITLREIKVWLKGKISEIQKNECPQDNREFQKRKISGQKKISEMKLEKTGGQ